MWDHTIKGSFPKVISNPITVTVIQKFVGDDSNRKSEREFLSTNSSAKIKWFRTLQEDHHIELRIQFGLSQAELDDLKLRGNIVHSLLLL